MNTLDSFPPEGISNVVYDGMYRNTPEKLQDLRNSSTFRERIVILFEKDVLHVYKEYFQGNNYKIENEKIVKDSKPIFSFPSVVQKNLCRDWILVDESIFMIKKDTVHVFNIKSKKQKTYDGEVVYMTRSGLLIKSTYVFYILTWNSKSIFMTGDESIVDLFDEKWYLCMSEIMVSRDTPGFSEGSTEKKNNIRFYSIVDGNIDISRKDAFLVIKDSIHSPVLYDCDGELIRSLDCIDIFRKKCSIRNVIDTHSMYIMCAADSGTMKLEKNKFHVILCEDYVFSIFLDIVIRKKLDKQYVRLNGLQMHDYRTSVSANEMVYWCLLYYRIVLESFRDLDDFLQIAIYNKIDPDSLISNIVNLSSEQQIGLNKIIGRTYRLVDDEWKKRMEKHINVFKHAEEIYYVVIYQEDLLELFVKRCIEEKRRFYFYKLYDFYRKTNRKEVMDRVFEKFNIKINKEGIEGEIERAEIESEKAVWILERKDLENTE